MNETEVHALLEEHGAMKTGHFLLSSGKHSDVFVQSAAILMYPGIAERLGHELGERFEGTQPNVVLGPAMGGVIIGHEIARRLNVPMIYAEREDGKMKLRRGFSLEPEARVLIAENTVTTGGSQKEVIELARSFGAEVIGVAAIVDRSPGVSFGVRFEALLHIEANAWPAEDCPLCREGSTPESPGSRHLGR
jgi:orotate phosphoribosyltransferase